MDFLMYCKGIRARHSEYLPGTFKQTSPENPRRGLPGQNSSSWVRPDMTRHPKSGSRHRCGLELSLMRLPSRFAKVMFPDLGQPSNPSSSLGDPSAGTSSDQGQRSRSTEGSRGTCSTSFLEDVGLSSTSSPTTDLCEPFSAPWSSNWLEFAAMPIASRRQSC
ncbi:hypothetical protein EJ05DRAFT_501742 [Pseudovirgaria hyperparasitica]|uniref:Uncharacterized protein n=1 Tax=Pseudovirgaria hyperparasitica TaxID=470096 RepID=A0A6A6W805_9PEZI|nr:uncharacterized protein EJ05DRAFT_501742 [Pseudovirgaria hyperparasitica]KAF2757211.1 hypothetical protein EJ05DRAFT_501742 [Pseudovirgaria hyperparasitica]